MITAELDTATLAATRIAASPAIEIVEWLSLTAAGHRHPRWGSTGSDARSALDHPDVALLAEVMPDRGSRYTPDLLTPKPGVGTAEQALRGQLESIAAAPAEVVARQLLDGRFSNGRVPKRVRAALDSGTFARRAANGMWRFWHTVLAGQWSGLHSKLEAEIAMRAAMMARSGVGAVLGSLHPRIRWRDGRLEIPSVHQLMFQLAGNELVLAPSVLTWPPVTTQFSDPSDAVLAYPAVRPDVARPRPSATPGLVGRSRAALLRDLGVPRSTSELSKRHGLAPATVSYHLGVLHRAGMVSRIRDGHVVYYLRNAPGDVLLGDDPTTGYSAAS